MIFFRSLGIVLLITVVLGCDSRSSAHSNRFGYRPSGTRSSQNSSITETVEERISAATDAAVEQANSTTKEVKQFYSENLDPSDKIKELKEAEKDAEVWVKESVQEASKNISTLKDTTVKELSNKPKGEKSAKR